MTTKIYLAGRITGDPDYRAKFEKAEKYYADQGAIVLNPAVLLAGMEKADYMRICYAMIDSADTVVLLSDWQASAGARAEQAYAHYIGKLITRSSKF